MDPPNRERYMESTKPSIACPYVPDQARRVFGGVGIELFDRDFCKPRLPTSFRKKVRTSSTSAHQD